MNHIQKGGEDVFLPSFYIYQGGKNRMFGVATIEIFNHLQRSKNAIEVHYSANGAKDIISTSNSIVVRAADINFSMMDYIDIQITGIKCRVIKSYWIELPIWANFQIISDQQIESILYIKDGRKKIQLLDGLLHWKLRISKPEGIMIPKNNIILIDDME